MNDRIIELENLLELLLEYRADGSIETFELASRIASACLGGQHLWQDMSLPSRDALSKIFEERFSRLAAENTNSMKWKRFLYMKLGERTGVANLRPPGCQGCIEHTDCYGTASSLLH